MTALLRLAFAAGFSAGYFFKGPVFTDKDAATAYVEWAKDDGKEVVKHATVGTTSSRQA